ncbi:MAG TPA: hypothetical protein VF266_03540 [Thermoanaerobaculia bacterium]
MRIWFLLAVALLVAIPASAQFRPREISDVEEGWSGESSYSNGQYLDNPCTAVQDWLWVDYQAYVSGWQAQAGVDRYLFDESTTMGGMYSASGTSLSDVGYGAPFTVRKYHKVNTADQFHVVTVITFNPATRTTTMSMETACGNGMPDSAQ